MILSENAVSRGLLFMSAICATAAIAPARSAESGPSTASWNTCGQRCVGWLLSHHGRDVSLHEITAILPGDAGTSLAQLRGVLEAYGLRTCPAHLSTEVLVTVRKPAVLHLRRGHFVVALPRAGDNAVDIVDPPRRYAACTAQDLKAIWGFEGDCLLVGSEDIVIPAGNGIGGFAECVLAGGAFVACASILGVWRYRKRASRRGRTVGGAIVVIAVLASGGQDLAQGNVAAPPHAQATISDVKLLQQSTHDAGAIYDDQEVVSHVFDVENHGEGKLIVRDIKSSCGCGAFQLDKKELPAGETARVRVSLHFGSRYGKLSAGAVVITNKGIVKLELLAVRKRRIDVRPSQIQFGRMAVGAAKCILVAVTPLDDNVNARIDKATATYPYIDIDEVKIETAPGQARQRTMRIRLSRGAPPGLIRGHIAIPCDGSVVKSVTIPIDGEIVGSIVPSRTVIQLGLLGGPIQKRTFEIELYAKGPFKVNGIVVNKPWLTASWVKEDGGLVRVIVCVSANLVPQGSLAGEIIIHTDASDMKEFTIPVYGYCEGV